MTLKQAAQSALDCQDACNLSGVAHSMLEAMAAIRAEPTNTVQVNQHPIVTMYLLKMNELNGCGSTLHQTYDPAEKACKAIAADLPLDRSPILDSGAGVMPKYTVNVGNVGQVHSGTDPIEARKHYDEYVAISRRGVGRAGGEQVTLFEDGEPLDEEEGKFEDYGDPTIPKCDSCQMLAINGINTHELGCPNSRKTWEEGEWILYRKCFTCGCDVRDGDSCCQPEE